jgi:nicotinamide mononucleotide transporter
VSTLREEILAMWPWEIIAVVSLIAYLVLAVRQNRGCWFAAVVGTAIYAVLFFRVGLYMESVLQVFYIAMAVYGLYSWSAVSSRDERLHVSRWPLAFHVPGIVLIAILTAISGLLLSEYSDASFPYLDSFTTWGGIVATWLVARKVLENWYYWFLIDSVSLYLYASRGLWLTTALFVLYLVLIVIGYRSWRASLFDPHNVPA